MANITLNSSGVLIDFWQFMPNPVLDSVGFIINLVKIVGILAIIYLVFLIVRSIFRARAMKDLRIAMNNIVEINHKLDKIILILEEKHGSGKDLKEKRAQNKGKWKIFRR